MHAESEGRIARLEDLSREDSRKWREAVMEQSRVCARSIAAFKRETTATTQRIETSLKELKEAVDNIKSALDVRPLMRSLLETEGDE